MFGGRGVKCAACYKGKVGRYSHCILCGYYQNSLISPKLYNYLKIPGNVEKLYSKLLDGKCSDEN